MLAWGTGVGDAILELVHAGHEGCAGRGAGWAHVEVIKADTLIVQAIDMWGLQERVPMPAEIAVALVIGENEDNVGLNLCVRNGGMEGKGHKEKVWKEFHRY